MHTYKPKQKHLSNKIPLLEVHKSPPDLITLSQKRRHNKTKCNKNLFFLAYVAENKNVGILLLNLQ